MQQLKVLLLTTPRSATSKLSNCGRLCRTVIFLIRETTFMRLHSCRPYGAWSVIYMFTQGGAGVALARLFDPVGV